jgi:hypothetical protein
MIVYGYMVDDFHGMHWPARSAKRGSCVQVKYDLERNHGHVVLLKQ